MKKTFQTFQIHAGTYDFRINFLITEDIERAIKFVNYKLELPCAEYLAINRGEFDFALGKIFRRKGYVPILWLPRKPVTNIELGTLAHEIFHAVCCVMRWADIPLSHDIEEAYCHLIKMIHTKFYEKIK